MKNKARTLFIIILLLLSMNIAVAKDEKVTLNFDGVDINIFLKTMSEITGKSFVISEKIKGKISFVSSKDVPVDRVYDIVLAILKVQGFFVVPKDENIVYIYPAQEALKMSGNIYYGTEQLELEDHMIITQIIPLRYAGANEVLNVVKPLFTNEMLIIAYPRTNVIIANGQASSINLLQGMIYFLDTEIPQAQSDIHIYNLENSDAESMARTLSTLASSIPVQKDKALPQQTEGTRAFFSERFKVVANKETNSIIIVSAPQDYEKIESIIKELDVKREQVLVEALIVEITLEDDEILGFDWGALIDTGTGVDALAQSNTGLMAESAAAAATGVGGLPGLTIGLLHGTLPSVYAILNAQKTNTNFKILSTPQIVTIDNYEAAINIGEQISFLTSSRYAEGSSYPINTYDYKDIGISLKITPHINKTGFITLDINQQVKKIVEGTFALQNPSVYNREINSRVTVQNQRTIVLGGLIRDDMVTIEQKVPLLGDIPLLGLLFRKRTKTRLRTNLLIFITPHIITADTEIETVTEQKRSEQEAFEDMDKDKKRKKRK